MILLNLLNYIISGILLQLLIEVKPQIETFKPNLRIGHTATIIDNKLYILGGDIISAITPSKESFLYLDISVSFNTNELKWYNLLGDIIPSHRYAAAIKGGANNNTLFLYGGEKLSGETMDLVYTYDTKNNIWRTPGITGTPPTGKVSVTSIIGKNGLMYWFGGRLGTVYVNDMFILDTINLNWKKASSIDAPSPRAEYSAVFLPSQNIIYIGGLASDSSSFTLNKVYLYDTINDVWTTKTTNGSIPSARYSISSVLGLDGQRIIIYGGLGQNGQIISTEDSVYVLDLNNYNWYIPKISGNKPSNRAFHKAVLIGKYMVITFGQGYTQGTESDILLLDIGNNDEYIWTTSFDPLLPSSTNDNVIIVVAVIISTIFFVSIAYVCVKKLILYYRRKKLLSIYLTSQQTIDLKNGAARDEITQNNQIPTSQYNNQVNNFKFDNSAFYPRS